MHCCYALLIKQWYALYVFLCLYNVASPTHVVIVQTIAFYA